MITAQRLAATITDLAVLKDVSINKMLQECKLNKSLIDSMKNGAMPSVDKVILIADYFGVSVEYLVGVTADPTQPKKYDYRDYGLKEDPFAQTDTDDTKYVKNKNLTIFSKKLKELRRTRGTFQAKLAEYLGLSTVTLSQYENEVRYPDTETLIKIAKYFNVSADYLLGIEDLNLDKADVIKEINNRWILKQLKDLINSLEENI